MARQITLGELLSLERRYRWNCNPDGLTLADALNERHPNEEALQRWIESFPLPEGLDGIAQQFIDEDDEIAG